MAMATVAQAEFKSRTMVSDIQETLKKEVDKMKYVLQVYALKGTIHDDSVFTAGSEGTVSPHPRSVAIRVSRHLALAPPPRGQHEPVRRARGVAAQHDRAIHDTPDHSRLPSVLQ